MIFIIKGFRTIVFIFIVISNSEWIFGIYKPNVLTWLELLLLGMIFLPVLIFCVEATLYELSCRTHSVTVIGVGSLSF